MPDDSIPSPKLAIVISCWNYEAYVASAISSVLAQDCDDCELVVVDDGSTDSSWAIIKQHEVKAFRVNNSGQLAACLYGLDRTVAPFVLFLDADDELAPGSIRRIIAELDANVAKLQFSLTRIDAKGNVVPGAVPLNDFRGRAELADRVLRTGTYATPPTSGNVFRRDICELLREVDYDRATDGVILFAAPFLGDIVSLSAALGYYRVHDRNDSGVGRPIDALSLKRDLQRFSDRMDHLRRILARCENTNELVRPEETYFFLERTFYHAIADGRRPSPRTLFGLLRQLKREHYSIKTKMALATFLVLMSAVPNARARRGLAYRLEVGNRSIVGMLRSIAGT